MSVGATTSTSKPPHRALALRENWPVVSTFGAGQIEAQRTGAAERHQLVLLVARLVAGVAKPDFGDVPRDGPYDLGQLGIRAAAVT